MRAGTLGEAEGLILGGRGGRGRGGEGGSSSAPGTSRGGEGKGKNICASGAAGRTRAWKFQKCAPVQLAYEPNWRVMISPGRGMGVVRRGVSARRAVAGPSLTPEFCVMIVVELARRPHTTAGLHSQQNLARYELGGGRPPRRWRGSFRPANTMDLDEDEDDNDVRAEERVLVGGEGGDFVAQTLSTAEDVGEAIKRVQESGALSADASEAEPLLGLLGQLGMTRAEVYRSVLDDALAQLAERIKVMPQGTLLSLLDASFRYVTIEELRAVPLAVLERLKPVPSSYLKQISRDVELFRRLPVEVQRQCWELKGMLLRRHATPCLLAYGEETATTMRNLDLDLVLSRSTARKVGACTRPAPRPPDPNPTAPRARSRAFPAAASAAPAPPSSDSDEWSAIPSDSTSGVALCRAHYAEHGVAAVCSLRSQLLMALHDDEMTDLCASDRVHRLAWLADACVRDRCLDGRRAAEMAAIVKQLDFDSKAGEREAAKAKARRRPRRRRRDAPRGRGRRRRRGGTRSKGLAPLKVAFGLGKKKEEKDSERADRDDGVAARREPERVAAPVRSVGGEAGNNTTERDDSDSDAPAGSMSRGERFGRGGENLLGDVGMILRDPPVLSLLLHETVRTLEGVVEAERVPKSEPRLAELTRFLALACGARKLLRDRVPSLPQPRRRRSRNFTPSSASSSSSPRSETATTRTRTRTKTSTRTRARTRTPRWRRWR